MEPYYSLFQVAKYLLSEDGSERTAEVLLRQVLETTRAERGFIVVREGDSYERKFDVGFDRARISAEERRFSRSLVRQALAELKPIHCRNLPEDARFGKLESVRWLGTRAVLVAPLICADEPYGVLYLDTRVVDGFNDEAREFLSEFSEVAALFLRKALEREALRRRTQTLEQGLVTQPGFEGLVTRHPKMLALIELVARVAASDATVLVLGETGTGKDLVARALHRNSSRRDRPFVALHCTALPTHLLESELFGHTRGAFTGAEHERAGRIASASGGTLFLDEIAELPADVQAKLLRFLQFGEIQRLGTDRVERVDVRVVAATHADLAKKVQAGTFRQDLYFRLKVLELRLPPLRERRSDVALLLEHSLREHWKRPGEPARFTPQAERLLYAYDYPGNVRELAHLVERACLLATGPELDVDLLPPELAGSSAGAGVWEPAAFTNEELKEAVRLARERAALEVERRFVELLLQRCGGNVSQAARTCGMTRTRLQKILARLREAPPGLPA